MNKPTPAFDIVIFGGSGDLSMRKLLPALYYNHCSGALADDGRIIGVARRTLTDADYRTKVEQACKRYVRTQDFTSETWSGFEQRLHYVSIDGASESDMVRLTPLLDGRDDRVRVFYLATAPDLFPLVCERLAAAGLVTDSSRVVLEKPIGRDLASAESINERVGAVFPEHQIYRIDHYLGKETVQNVLALRFGNSLFEPLWQRGFVRDVQITVAEQIGVEGRGEFYDRAGALRDMVQNHLLQVLCLVAMEPPTSIDPDAVRDEKIKVLRSLRPFEEAEALTNTVRGQYVAGASAGEPVPGYLEEPGIPTDSHTETYVALRTTIDNWRWAGVPFFLRTGKRLQERISEVVINFQEIPHRIYSSSTGLRDVNRLVIRLQPEERVRLHLMAKAPREDMSLRPVHLNLDFAETFKGRQPDAYESLLLDALQGKPTLFMRRDEVHAGWRWVEPILHTWANEGKPPRRYTAGTWGPSAASGLIGRDDLHWHEDA